MKFTLQLFFVSAISFCWLACEADRIDDGCQDCPCREDGSCNSGLSCQPEGIEFKCLPEDTTDTFMADSRAPDTSTSDTTPPDTSSGQDTSTETDTNTATDTQPAEDTRLVDTGGTCSLTVCGGECVDTTSSTAHCGGCNAACTGTQVCVSSSCSCPSGEVLCEGACTQGTSCATFSNSGQSLGNRSSTGVALGDLDGDGSLDALVCNSDQNRVWFNDGKGVFTDGGQVVGGPSLDCALGHFNSDEHLDVVLAGGTNAVWTNNGSGIFTDTGQALGNANLVALADVDKNGQTDAVFISSDDSILAWLNSGSSLSQGTPTTYSRRADSMAMGDWDKDGDVDLISIGTSGGSGSPWAYTNNGLGVFGDADLLGTYPERTYSERVAAGDLNGDRADDIVIAGTQGENRVYLSDGSGAFQRQGRISDFSSNAVAVGDLDGDGDLDAFFSKSRSGTHHVALNDGSGTLTDTHSFTDSGESNGVALGDLDGDGDLDAFIIYEGPNSVWFND